MLFARGEFGPPDEFRPGDGIREESLAVAAVIELGAVLVEAPLHLDTLGVGESQRVGDSRKALPDERRLLRQYPAPDDLLRDPGTVRAGEAGLRGQFLDEARHLLRPEHIMQEEADAGQGVRLADLVKPPVPTDRVPREPGTQSARDGIEEFGLLE